MGLVALLGGVRATVFAALCVLLGLFGGWNWWRKNVYHDALTLTATKSIQAQRAAENDLQSKLNRQAEDLAKRSKTREETLERQLADAARSPSQRIEYRLRDRWLPVSCPSGTAGGAEPAQAGGLHPEDERDLVRIAFDGDTNTDERNALIGAYNQAREAALKANKERARGL